MDELGQITVTAPRPPLEGRLTNWGGKVEPPTVTIDEVEHQLEWNTPMTFDVEYGEHLVVMNAAGLNPQDTWCWVDEEGVDLRLLVKRWRGINSDRIRYQDP